MVVISAKTIWNQNFYSQSMPRLALRTFESSFFLPTVGPVCPKVKLAILPAILMRPLDPLSRSSGGALPALPLRPLSLNGTM